MYNYAHYFLRVFFSMSIKPCGVDYQLKTHLAESLDEKPEKL